MTSPALDETYVDPASDPHDDGDLLTGQERQVLLALTALLAAGVSGQRLTDRAIALLGPLGVSPLAVRAAVQLAASHPAHGVPRVVALRGATAHPTAPRTAASRAVSAEPAQRARYFLAAARRLTAGLLDGRTGFTRALQVERGYRQQHLDAQTRRLTAAAGVDVARVEHGEVLGWHTVMDDRTTPDCAALDGTNFRADQEPAGGWPGARHGGTCRCSAGEPHVASAALDELVQEAA